jgi:gliotoxin/aspirochlorine biosynthesis gamma-glutamylcyclotransferase
MVVILTQPTPTQNVWYLAYGSNLSSEKFVRDRGIKPLASIVVTVPGYTLAMDSSGVPYSEPSYASIRPISFSSDRKEREVLGTAYLLTPRQYVAVIASEGGSIAYREEALEALEVPVDEASSSSSRPGAARRITVRTLVTVLPRRPEPRPSQRYMVCRQFTLLLGAS